MPSANKTPNYNLTQYSNNGSDKISALKDYNEDMSKIDTALNDNANNIITKADKSATYSKTDVDTKLSTKADTATTYSKTDVDTKLSTKADTATTYSKTDVDTKLAVKADTTTVDGKIQQVGENQVLLSITRDTSLTEDVSFNHAFISKSYDGINWYIVKDFSTNEKMSDAPTLYAYNGYIYVIDMNGSYVTKDLESWTNFSVSGGMNNSHDPGPMGYWAPKLFCNKDNGALYIAAACQYKDGVVANAVGNTYYFKPCFFDVSVGDGGVLTVGNYHEMNLGMGENDSYIDPYILRHNGLWYLAVKNEITTTIEIYTSADLVNWSEISVNNNKLWGVEAPELVEVSNDVLGLYVSGYSINNSTHQTTSFYMKSPKALFQEIPTKINYSATDKYGVSYHEVKIPVTARHFCVCQVNSNQYNKINCSMLRSITVNSDKKEFSKIAVSGGIAIASNDPDCCTVISDASVTELYLSTIIDIRESSSIIVRNTATNSITLTSTPVSKYPEMAGIGDASGNFFPNTITIPGGQFAIFVPDLISWCPDSHPWRCISITHDPQD